MCPTDRDYALPIWGNKMNLKKLHNKHFPLPLKVRFINGVMWKLLYPFEYHRRNGEIIKVPPGFKFDFASIPKPFWSIIGSPTGRYGPAALIHDYLCVMKPYPYSKIDRIFYEAMRDLKIPYLKRTVMYWAVCIFHIIKP